MWQIVIINQLGQYANNIFMCHEIFQFGRTVFFHPWHLYAFIWNGGALVDLDGWLIVVGGVHHLC